jgi:hypothetical protein
MFNLIVYEVTTRLKDISQEGLDTNMNKHIRIKRIFFKKSTRATWYSNGISDTYIGKNRMLKWEVKTVIKFQSTNVLESNLY